MREQVTMPQLGETVTEGTVVRWLHQAGETVAADEPLLEIQTDKVSMEVPALRGGLLVEVLVDEGQTVPVGAVLAWMETDGGGAVGPPGSPPVQDVASMLPEVPAPRADLAVDAEPSDRRPTPLVRRLLAEAGLRAADVTGTGPGGRILREDVAAAASAAGGASPAALSQPSPPAPSRPQPPQGTPAAAVAPVKPSASGGRSEPLTPLRRVIAERMVASLHTSAQLTSVVEVDVTGVTDLRRRAASLPALQGLKVSYLPFFIRAAVAAIESHPDINASIDAAQGSVIRHDAVHLAIAVDTDAGLLAPVIRNAERLSVIGLVHAIAELARRTREGMVTPDELTGGTFTITNTGSRGALFDTPIINQPQVAILATGAVMRRAVVVTDPLTGLEGIAIRSMAYLALTYDHRLVDGAAAAAFLVDVKTRLEARRFDEGLGVPLP